MRHTIDEARDLISATFATRVVQRFVALRERVVRDRDRDRSSSDRNESRELDAIKARMKVCARFGSSWVTEECRR